MITLAAALIGGLLQIALYPDADQLDSGYHFLFARWSWHHPEYLLSVWGRPLFTLIYSFPAQFGYGATRIFTLLISLLTGHQTWRLARQLGLGRAHLAIPLLLDREIDLISAIIASFKAVLQNPGPMIGFGLIVVALSLVALAPFFLGLLVVLPVLGHATWHLYIRVIAPLSAAG